MNAHQNNSGEPHEGDLDWLAFRYVSGEMPTDEAALFEQTLAEDQTARDAVASAVQLTDAVLALAPTHSQITQPVPATRRNVWRERAAWMVAGAAAACVLFLVSWDMGHTPRGSDMAISAEKAGEINRVAAVWSDTNLFAQADMDTADDDDDVAADPLHDVQVPGWLLAAVCGDESAKEKQEETN